jgi:hypothetical protein
MHKVFWHMSHYYPQWKHLLSASTLHMLLEVTDVFSLHAVAELYVVCTNRILLVPTTFTSLQPRRIIIWYLSDNWSSTSHNRPRIWLSPMVLQSQSVLVPEPDDEQHAKLNLILDNLLWFTVLQISMWLPPTRLFICIAIRSSDYMATCSDPHLGHLQANILHKINYNYMINL